MERVCVSARYSFRELEKDASCRHSRNMHTRINTHKAHIQHIYTHTRAHMHTCTHAHAETCVIVKPTFDVTYISKS